MDQETQDFKEKQKLLQNELQKYRDNKTNYKSYMQFMDDISAWLQERIK